MWEPGIAGEMGWGCVLWHQQEEGFQAKKMEEIRSEYRKGSKN